MGIAKVGIGHTQFYGFGIHIGDELLHRSRSGPSEGHGAIIV